MGMRQTWWERPVEIKWHGWVCKAMLGFAWDESVWVRLNFSELPGGCSEFSVRFLSRFCQGFCFKETSEYFASLPFSVWSPSFITWFSWLCGLKWERSKSKFFLLYFIYFFIIIIFISFYFSFFFQNPWASPSEHDSSRNSSERRWFWWLFLGLARRPILLA